MEDGSCARDQMFQVMSSGFPKGCNGALGGFTCSSDAFTQGCMFQRHISCVIDQATETVVGIIESRNRFSEEHDGK